MMTEKLGKKKYHPVWDSNSQKTGLKPEKHKMDFLKH